MKTAKELALMAARALSDKKGREIQVLEIGDLTTLADYFVIATGSSNTQINALVDNVEKVLREEAQEEPLHREGYRAGTWVLLALSVGLPLWLDGSFGPLAAAVGYGLAVWYGFRNLDGMSGDISGFALTLGELCGCGAAILWR